MKVALVSLDQIWQDKVSNMQLCEVYIKEATKFGADLVIFPEMTLTGFSMDIEAIAESERTSKTVEKFTRMATKHQINLMFGVVIRADNRARNVLYFVDKKGDIKASYTKIHPFTYAGENKYFISGEKATVVRCNEDNLALTICYDLRFPELYAVLAESSDIMINIANWPARRIDHWQTLLKARAIENQVFMIGVNRTGIDGNGLEYVESSAIYNANGDKLEPYDTFKDMQLFDVDTNWTKMYRKRFNTVADRRIELYQELIKHAER